MVPPTSPRPDLDPRKLSRQLAELYYLTPSPSTWFIQASIIILYVLAFLSVSVAPGLIYSLFSDIFPDLAYGLLLIGFLIGAFYALIFISLAQLITMFLAMANHMRQTRDMLFYLLVNDPQFKIK